MVKWKVNDRRCTLIAARTKNLIVVIIAECVINHLLLICSSSRCRAQGLKELSCYLAAPSNQREDVSETQQCISNLWDGAAWCAGPSCTEPESSSDNET